MSQITDDDIQEAREEVETLEATAAQLRQALATSESSRNNAVRQATLKNQAQDLRTEIARLQEQLNVSKEAPTANVVEEPAIVADEPPVSVPTYSPPATDPEF